MGKKTPCVVVTFPTTADAMHMQSLAGEWPLQGRLAPIPRQLSAGCGFAWREPVKNRPLVEELLKREPYDAPTFVMDPSVTDFYQFTVDSFRLENYRYHPFTAKIPVAI